MPHRKKPWFSVICIVLALLILFGSAYLLLCQLENMDIPPELQGLPVFPGSQLTLNGKTYRIRQNLETLLLLGIDNFGPMESSGSYLNDGQSDVITLVILDKTANTYTLLHLNRDTMTDVQRLGLGGAVIDTVPMQLALAHTYGNGMETSCRNAVTAVRNLLYNIPINHYLAVNMTGLEKMVDALGGVTVTVRGDFSQVDPTLIEGETMKLSGSQCMTYLRSRYLVGDQSNLERNLRQRQFLQELLDSRSLSQVSAEQLLPEIAEYMLTDMNATRLSDLMERLSKASLAEIASPKGEAVLGKEYIEFYVNQSDLEALVIRLFCQPA